jgi:hypothetical protein
MVQYVVRPLYSLPAYEGGYSSADGYTFHWYHLSAQSSGTNGIYDSGLNVLTVVARATRG